MFSIFVVVYFSAENLQIKCSQSVDMRKPLRLLIEILLFFLVPSAATGFFYFRINQVLKRPSAERHAKRNATVTMAFRGSWILWVASWTPAYVVLMAFSFANFEQYTTFGIILDSFIIYTMQFVFPIQMLHSHVNPIFYLLTIKDFKDCVAKWTKRIGSIIICTKNGDRTKSGIEERRFKPSVQSRNLVSPFLLLVGFLCLIPASLYLSLMIEANQSHALPLSTKLTAEASSRIIEEKVQQYYSDADIVKNIHLHNVREKCSANRGVYNYQMRRCYFILHHGEPGLNFSAQVSACRMKGAALSYPRKEEEVLYLWDLFEGENNHLTVQYFRNFSLHIGLFLGPEFNTTYHSVDYEMLFEEKNPSWFYMKTRQIQISRQLSPSRSPSICITKAKTLSQCLPRQRKAYSICCYNM